jgi:PadR family transcriptional regulator, regulatory protein PadR
MSFRGDLEALVLAILAGEALHGYEITRRVNGLEGVKMLDGQLYPLLHRLEADGFIEAEWVPQQGKPARKVYRLTESGAGRLEKKRGEWEAFAASVSQLLTRPTEPQLN